MILSSTARCYLNRDRWEQYIYGDELGRVLLYRNLDSNSFYELKQTGFNGSASSHVIHFDNPLFNSGGVIEKIGNNIKVNNVIFESIQCPTGIIHVIPLPHIRIPEYLFKIENGLLLYVSADKYYYSYESFKLFIGPHNRLTEIQIVSVNRYRDGGTTKIDTVAGELFCPSPFMAIKKPTWKGKEIIKLDPNGGFKIHEKGKVVQIMRWIMKDEKI